MEEVTPKKDNKKIQTLLIIIIVIISVSAIIGFTLSSENINNEPAVPIITTSYSAILPEDAQNLIMLNETPLIIVDIRSCKCKYDDGCLPNAIWNRNPYSFVNLTEDLLVYSDEDADCIEFFEELLNNTYSRLFYLEGGYDAWKNAGYPTES